MLEVTVDSQSSRLVDDGGRGHHILKRGAAKIAQSNRSTDLKALEQDVVQSATFAASTSTLEGKKGERKPKLPFPGFNSKTFRAEDTGHRELSLIAIIGNVLTLQAKTNSNFWSTLWQQASQSMNMEVNFAPIVGDAIRSQYDATSQKTMTESNQEWTNAFINGAAFVGSVALGLTADIKTEENEITDDAVKAVNETEVPEPVEGITSELEANPANTEETLAQDAKVAMSGENDGFKEKLVKLANGAKKAGSWMQKKLSVYVPKIIQASQMTQQMANVGTGFSSWHYKSQQATWAGKEGQAAALSQQSQMYAQYYGQNYQRSEDLRQGTAQNIDYALNIMLQTSRSLTDAVSAMFRG